MTGGRRTCCKANHVAGTLHPLGFVCLSMTARMTLLLSGFTASSWVMVMICGVSAGVSPPGGSNEAHTQSGAWQFWGLQLYLKNMERETRVRMWGRGGVAWVLVDRSRLPAQTCPSENPRTSSAMLGKKRPAPQQAIIA